MRRLLILALSLQEQYQYNYITKPEQLLPPKKVNTLTEVDEEKVKQIWIKVGKRANQNVFSTFRAYFDKVRVEYRAF